jgi:hypothetical protein
MSTSSLQSLLERHVPVLVYPAHHTSRFTEVKTLVEHPQAQLLMVPSGAVIASANGPSRTMLSLDFLRAETYPSGVTVRQDDRITLREGAKWESTILDGVDDVVYGRAVEVDDERSTVFLQYWLFAPFTPGPFGHEGDIQLIQLMLTPDRSEVQEVLLTQHGGAEVRHIGQTQTRDGHARVFVSNRNGLMFAPGKQWTRAGWWPDSCYVASDEPGVRPRLERLDSEKGWASWPGRFGNRRAFCARPYWDDPTQAWALEGRRGPFAWVDPARFMYGGKEMKRRDIRARDRLRKTAAR